MTLEEKAEEYLSEHRAESPITKQAFIAGYTMRDGESQEIIMALQDLMVMFELIRETCNTSLGDIAYKNAEWAISNLPQPPKND